MKIMVFERHCLYPRVCGNDVGRSIVCRVWGTEHNLKISERIAGLQDKIWTRDLPIPK